MTSNRSGFGNWSVPMVTFLSGKIPAELAFWFFICISTFMLESKLCKWCYQLFSFLSAFLNIHHDLLFLLVLILVFVLRILVRALCHFHSKKWINVPEIVWTISTCIICAFVFYEFFLETAECAGQDGCSSSSANPEPDEDTLFWQKAVETKFRQFLNERRLHIPRPHTIHDLREEICGQNATKLHLALLLEDLNKKQDASEHFQRILLTIRQWKEGR